MEGDQGTGGSLAQLRVKDGERKGFLSIAPVPIGNMFSASALLVGATIGAGLTLADSLLAIVFGFGFVMCYMCFVVMEAADTGLPTAAFAGAALGRSGARYLVAIIVGVACLGWFGIQAAVCGASFSLMMNDLASFDVPVWASTVFWGAIMVVTAVYGFNGLRYLGYVAAPLLAIICVYGTVVSVSSGGGIQALLGYVPAPEAAIALVAGVNFAIGVIAMLGTTAGDFIRYARDRKTAVLTCLAGLLPAGVVVLMMGAIMSISTGEANIAVIMASFGLPAVGLVALVLSTWTVNASNVYSAGLGFSVMLGRDTDNRKSTTAVAGLIGIAFAAAGILDHLTVFLNVLSACAPALAGTMIADYWIVNRGDKAKFCIGPGFRACGMIAFSVGTLVALVTGGTFGMIPALAFLDVPFFIGPVNGIVVSIVVFMAAHRLIEVR
ncbi:cytosine permease [Raoultibacter phocaeensis]|uniref:cytosine permease n=1 Tax=Raoultibacter phocaeensis TaxID=2479841 RepID=UPI001C58790C|nr:cytosine permease [Raoultibacter phocaeensis]